MIEHDFKVGDRVEYFWQRTKQYGGGEQSFTGVITKIGPRRITVHLDIKSLCKHRVTTPKSLRHAVNTTRS